MNEEERPMMPAAAKTGRKRKPKIVKGTPRVLEKHCFSVSDSWITIYDLHQEAYLVDGGPILNTDTLEGKTVTLNQLYDMPYGNSYAALLRIVAEAMQELKSLPYMYERWLERQAAKESK